METKIQKANGYESFEESDLELDWEDLKIIYWIGEWAYHLKPEGK